MAKNKCNKLIVEFETRHPSEELEIDNHKKSVKNHIALILAFPLFGDVRGRKVHFLNKCR